MAVSSVYSIKFFSLLLPFLGGILFIVQKGWRHFKFNLPVLAIFFVLLITWSGLSLFWAVHEKAALKAFFSLSMTLIFSYVFLDGILKSKTDLTEKTYKTLILFGLFLATLIVFQSFLDTFQIHPLARFTYLLKPAGSALGLLGFVTCAFLWTKGCRKITFLSFALLLCLILLTTCQTALYAFVAASGFFAISYALPFWTTRFAMIGSYTLLLLSPILHAYILLPMKVMTTPYLSSLLS